MLKPTHTITHFPGGHLHVTDVVLSDEKAQTIADVFTVMRQDAYPYEGSPQIARVAEPPSLSVSIRVPIICGDEDDEALRALTAHIKKFAAANNVRISF